MFVSRQLPVIQRVCVCEAAYTYADAEFDS